MVLHTSTQGRHPEHVLSSLKVKSGCPVSVSVSNLNNTVLPCTALYCPVVLQLNTLEIVGQSRHAGAVSAEMANALGIQHRNFFYVLKVRS